MKKITIIFNKLCKAASNHNLKQLSIEGEPSQRRRNFVRWIESLKDILRTHHQTMQILQEYPILPTTLDDIPNEALGLFLRANISGQVKSILTGTSSENGLAILHRLQKMYASATMEDQASALCTLNALQMHPKDTINSFIFKF